MFRRFRVLNNKMPRFVSIHIPKCGGVTFLWVLRLLYGDDCLFDNGLCPITPGFGRIRPYPQNWWDYNVIHGHFDYAKYSHVPLITWVREPIDRLISLYHYWQTKNQDNVTPAFMRAHSLSIYQFAEFLPNVQTMFIGEKIERFAFIGLVEFYEESLERFGNIMGLEIPKYRKRNVNKKSKDVYNNVERGHLELYLKKDRIVYNKILEKWCF